MESSAVSFRPNIAQKEAILHKPAPLMILAGAGTGKTTTSSIIEIILKKTYKKILIFSY